MSFGGIVGASGMCCTQEIWNPIGISWERVILSWIGKEGFGRFLPERKKRRRRRSRSRDGVQVSRHQFLLHTTWLIPHPRIRLCRHRREMLCTEQFVAGQFLFLDTLHPILRGVRWRTTRFGLRSGAIGIRRRVTWRILPRAWGWVRRFAPCAKLWPS